MFIVALVLAITVAGCMEKKTYEVEIIGHREVEVLQDKKLTTIYYVEVKKQDSEITYYVEVNYTQSIFGPSFKATYPIGTKFMVEENQLKENI